MIMFTTKMCHLTAVVLDEDADSVTKELLKEGVLHFVKATDVSDDVGNYTTNLSPKVSQSRISDTRKRIESFFNLISYSPADIRELDVSKLTSVNIEGSNNTLDKVAVDLQKIRDNQKYSQQEIHKLEEIKRQLAFFSNIDENIELSGKYMFLSLKTGTIPETKEKEFLSELQSLPSVQIKLGAELGLVTILLIAMKRDLLRVEKILQKFEWTDIDYTNDLNSLGVNALSEIDAKINNYKIKQEEAGNSAKELILSKKEMLDELWANLRMNELFYRMQSFYSKTSRTMIFSGWLPTSKKQTLESGIISITKGRCYLEWSDPRDIKKEKNKNPDVPVEMKNPKFLSPFEMLVRNYAIPEYGTVDPTPIVAVAYLLMFGLMFGDVGHGFIVFLTGITGTLLTLKSAKIGIHKLCQLMIWCGCAAMITGVLFGSYFGYGWFKPLWFNYHGIIAGHPGHGVVKNIYGILLITIYFGIAVIGLGLILNWVNCISKRDWFKLLMDKGGIVGGWMYGAGVAIAFYFVKHDYKGLPDSNLLFILLGLPAIFFMLKPPIEFYLHNKKGHAKKFTIATLLDFAMEWVVEMLEIFSGYLANTLSFMRVAGLGIAHVSLMIAFDQIAKMVTNDGSFNAWSILILIAGNVLVIGLEGLSAGIQSLRLNYYEFFSKYFSGTGKAYAPISLKGKN